MPPRSPTFSRTSLLHTLLLSTLIGAAALPALAANNVRVPRINNNNNNNNNMNNNNNNQNRNNNRNNNNNQNNANNKPIPALDSGAANTAAAGESIKAQTSELSSARAAVKQAQTDLNDLVAKRTAEFDQSPEVKSLISQVDEDTKNLNDVIIPAIRETIAKDIPTYPELVSDRDAARIAFDAIAGSKEQTDDIKYRTANFHLLDDKVKAIETPYFTKNHDYNAASEKLKADSANLAAARAKINDFLAKDGDYVALTQVLANAKARVDALENPVATP